MVKDSAARMAVWSQGLLRGCWMACLAWLLTACASSGPHLRAGIDAPTESWSGRLSLTIQSEPVQSFTAEFDLVGSARQGELRLYSPLGSTLAQLQWSPQGARLTRDGQVVSADTVETLLTQATGAALPVAALFDWLHQRPAQAPGWLADTSQLADGRLSVRRTDPLPEAELRIKLQAP